jgi:hypothetical protein
MVPQLMNTIYYTKNGWNVTKWRPHQHDKLIEIEAIKGSLKIHEHIERMGHEQPCDTMERYSSSWEYNNITRYLELTT